MHINELTGTMSWRTLRPGPRPGASRQEPAAPGGRAEAAALRAAGLDPSRVRARGAAPIPANPTAVRAAVDVHVESLTPEQLQHHLARVGALRSRVAGDAARGTGTPAAVAARVRSGGSAARVHALSAEHASAAREAGRRGPAAAPGAARPGAAPPAPGPRPHR
ncbi:hypothetical protein ACFY93_24220 [Streptomyces sp. NPDC008313]|uniref:hypothetical protein n=1 Tax=Streptomyces sp. NPDC008313 TaxID=3364826 RepID=UPI0036EAC1B1